MRVALVHSFYRSEFPSGENRAVEMQAEALSNAGHEVYLVKRRTDDFEQGIEFKVRSGLRIALDRGANPLLEIKALKPDIVHIHNLFPNWTTSWIARTGIPTVATFHNYRSFCAAGTLSRNGSTCTLCPSRGSQNAIIHGCYRGSAVSSIPLAVASRKNARPRVLADVDAGVFLSERSKRLFESFCSLPTLSEVIPNFTHPSSESRENQKSSRLRKGWVFVGRLSSEKGILPLITQWPCGEHLTVVGSGPMEEQCRQAAIGKDITFAGGMSPDSVRLYLASAEGLIFSSIWQEPAPSLTYVEALAEGTPIIAFQGSSVADDVEKNQTGVVVDSFRNLRSAFRAIRRNWDFFHQRDRERYWTTFSPTMWVEEIVSFYLRVQSNVSNNKLGN